MLLNVTRFLEKYPILSIILFVGLMLLPLLNVMDVSIMEARNFITAREMLTDGNWILTTMNGKARYQKPPLPTWLSAISAMIFGVKSVWAMRFPAVLMVMLLGIMIFKLSRKLKLSSQHSLINSFIAITSIYVLLIIFEAPWDIYAHAFMLSGIYFLFKRLNDPNSKFVIFDWLLASLCLGASILSKGPVSLYVLFLPFVISYIIVYKNTTSTKKWVSFSAFILVGILLGFSWFVYVRYADPTAFNAIAKKETGNWTSYNVRPFYYYWSFFLQSGIWTIPALISLFYPYMKSRVCDIKAYKFTLFWTLIAVVLLSIIPEKKSRYLMPVLIPLAINIGFYLEYLIRSFKTLKDKRERFIVYFNFGLITLLFTIVSISGFILGFKETYVRFFDIAPLFIVLVLGIYSFIQLKKGAIKRVILGILACFILILNIGLKVYANYLSTITHSNKITIESINREVTTKSIQNLKDLSDYPVYTLNNGPLEIIWEYGQKIPFIYEDKILKTPSQEKFYALTTLKDSIDLREVFPKAKIDYLFTVDINNTPKDDRAYKKRKVVNLFLVAQ